MIAKTYHIKSKEIARRWYLVDAKDKVLGRLASRVATILMGKNKSNYSPHLDVGDSVAVFNCEKIVLTGKKAKQKVYRRHSGYPGGFKEVSFEKMIKENPAFVIRHAVSGMLPDNRLKPKRLKRLKIFVGDNNPFIEKVRSLNK